jgi:hypothetical protein
LRLVGYIYKHAEADKPVTDLLVKTKKRWKGRKSQSQRKI